MIPETERSQGVPLAEMWPLTWQQVLGFLVPLRLDPREHLVVSTYLGVASVAFALATLPALQGNRTVRALWLLVIIGIWIGLGDDYGLQRVVRAVVPLWDKFRYSVKLTLVVSVAVALLAGTGFATLPARLRRRWGVLLVALMTVELVSHTQPLLWTVDDSFYAEPVLAKAMRQHGVGLYGPSFERLDDSHYGIDEGAFANMAAVGGRSVSTGAFFDLPDVSFYTQGRSGRAVALLSGNDFDVASRARIYGILGAGYLVESATLAAAGRPEIVAREPHYGYVLVRQKHSLPRAYASHRALAVKDVSAARSILLGATFKPGREITAEADAPHPDWASRPDEPAIPATITARTNASVTISAELPWPGFVVLNEAMFKGWTATVDGRPVPILVANGFVRAVEVPAGHHVVFFSFTTPGLATGIVITLLTLLACLVWLIKPLWPGREGHPRAEEAE